MQQSALLELITSYIPCFDVEMRADASAGAYASGIGYALGWASLKMEEGSMRHCGWLGQAAVQCEQTSLLQPLSHRHAQSSDSVQ